MGQINIIKLLILLLLSLITMKFSYCQCNGHIELCSKTYDQVAYLTTHNAFNSTQENLLFPNQTNDISKQLSDGVRALMIDVYDHFGIPTAYHSFYILGSIPISEIFNDIKDFLDNNPNEIVTIILECYVSADAIENEIINSGLTNYLYAHNISWPTLQNMINNNTRLVIFSDENDANASQNWYHYIWDYAVETHFNINSINDFSCEFNRGDSTNNLFILNHFVTDINLGYGLYNESQDVNQNPFFINRVESCQNEKNKFPNFLTVDFYELGNSFNVLNQVNNVNFSNNIKDITNFKTNKLTAIKNVLGKKEKKKKNTIQLYIYENGNVEKKMVLN